MTVSCDNRIGVSSHSTFKHAIIIRIIDDVGDLDDRIYNNDCCLEGIHKLSAIQFGNVKFFLEDPLQLTQKGSRRHNVMFSSKTLTKQSLLRAVPKKKH